MNFSNDLQLQCQRHTKIDIKMLTYKCLHSTLREKKCYSCPFNYWYEIKFLLIFPIRWNPNNTYLNCTMGASILVCCTISVELLSGGNYLVSLHYTDGVYNWVGGSWKQDVVLYQNSILKILWRMYCALIFFYQCLTTYLENKGKIGHTDCISHYSIHPQVQEYGTQCIYFCSYFLHFTMQKVFSLNITNTAS